MPIYSTNIIYNNSILNSPPATNKYNLNIISCKNIKSPTMPNIPYSIKEANKNQHYLDTKNIENKTEKWLQNNSNNHNIETTNYYDDNFLSWNGHFLSLSKKKQYDRVNLHKQNILTPFEITNGLKKTYENKKIKVKDFTIRNLKIAQQTIDMVKSGLCYGSGNQIIDLFSSAGESDLRTIHARTNTDITHPFSSLISGGSNCGGIAQLTAAILVRNNDLIDHPISIVKGGTYDNGQKYDHDYVIIGDPFDSKYGIENTVVVDPWGVLAIPTTLSESIFPNPNIVATKPQGVVKNFVKKDMENLYRESTEGIQNILKQKFNTDLKPGKELLLSLLREDNISGLWNIFITAKDPSTQYYSDNIEDTYSFDDIPKDLFQYKLHGIKLANSLGYGSSMNLDAWDKIHDIDLSYKKSNLINLSQNFEITIL
ncbi:hypothetical protein ETN89_21030 (plasmid) [Photobacterium damselae subsp. damselae]|uniref:hypothetical protein n=1 Tax=Photobacterium damselae TaxID=38293 RepID=UPI000A2FE0B2|nr:hypothetical protein [Photobacterium damselae]ARR51733.1 hypothetical protein CAY62_20165 [Photobacterium damselae subsp. damselae]QAY37703.1 hypothetical protein ETN89_21030 [Photobacterium damselae subsp. damselae]